MTIVNMLRFERFGVQGCRFWGPSWGPFLFLFGTKSGQEPSQSDCDTIFIFESDQTHILKRWKDLPLSVFASKKAIANLDPHTLGAKSPLEAS